MTAARLRHFRDQLSPTQRERVRGVVGDEHWRSLTAAADRGDDVSADAALRALHADFERRKAESPFTTLGKLALLSGSLGGDLSQEFLDLLGEV